MHGWPQEREMGMNLSGIDSLGGRGGGGVLYGWFWGFEYGWRFALCIKW